MKYDFNTTINGNNDIFTNLVEEVSIATNELLGIGLLVIIFTVSLTIFLSRTQDIGKSAISSLHITLIMSFLLYYWGKSAGFDIIKDVFMLIIILVYVGLLAFMKYNRQDQL